MTEKYRAVMLTKKGGPEVLQVVELPVEAPGPGQLRVRMRAAGVGSTDLVMLTGGYLYAPKIPFVPELPSQERLNEDLGLGGRMSDRSRALDGKRDLLREGGRTIVRCWLPLQSQSRQV